MLRSICPVNDELRRVTPVDLHVRIEAAEVDGIGSVGFDCALLVFPT